MNFPIKTTVACLKLLLFTCISTTLALKLLKVEFVNDLEREKFQLFVDEYNIDVWHSDPKQIQAVVQDDMVDEVAFFFNITILNYNLDDSMRKSVKDNEKSTRRNWGQTSFLKPPLQYFARYGKIVDYMKRVSRILEQKASIQTIGESHEGRVVKAVRLRLGNEPKPAVLIISGQHAREWLAIASAVYVTDNLVAGILWQRPRIINLLKKLDFYIIPVVNPDGYEYTFTGDGKNRLWRKTRSKQRFGCDGVDPNRNFDVDFKPLEPSCVDDTCATAYRGLFAFSEACTRNIRDFVMNPTMRNRIKLFFDLHSYGQQFFYPLGYNSSKRMSDHDEVVRVANISVNALMRVNGRKFLFGPPGVINYNASGLAFDWFKEVLGVKYAYLIETYPALNSPNGFLVQPKEIEKSGREVSEAILSAAENMKF